MQSRNHPSSFYYSILLIEFGDKGRDYLFCVPTYYEGARYAEVKSGARNNTNPNATKGYENVPMAAFLKKHDPWYRDENSPPITTRPSYPDKVP